MKKISLFAVLGLTLLLVVGCGNVVNTNTGDNTTGSNNPVKAVVATGSENTGLVVEDTGNVSDDKQTGDNKEVVVGKDTELATGDVDLTGEDLKMFNEVRGEIMGTMKDGLKE